MKINFPSITDSMIIVDAKAFMVESRAKAETLSINALITMVATLGYTTPGDMGGAVYKRVVIEPTHAGKFEDALGNWFEIVPNSDGFITTYQIGYFGDGVTDCVDDFNSILLEFGKLYFMPSIDAYWLEGTLAIPSNGAISGSGWDALLRQAPNVLQHVYAISNLTRVPVDAAARDTNISISNIAIDGNRAANVNVGEWWHCIGICAAVNVEIDNVLCYDAKGDGIILQYGVAENATSSNSLVYCEGVTITRSQTNGCARQGLAIAAAIKVQFNHFSIDNDLLGFDIEPDNADNICEDISGFVSIPSGGTGVSTARGGIAVYGAGGRTVKRVHIIIDVGTVDGLALIARDCENVFIGGVIGDTTVPAIFIAGGGSAATEITLDLEKSGDTSTALVSNGVGSAGPVCINGRIIVNSASPDIPFNLSNNGPHNLELILNGSSAQQGLYLVNVDDSNFIGSLPNCTGAAIVLQTGCINNTFNGINMYSSGAFGTVVSEDATCSNNHFTGCISELPGSSISLLGTGSTYIGSPRAITANKVFSVPAALKEYSTSTVIFSISGDNSNGDHVTVLNRFVSADYGLLEAYFSAPDQVSVRAMQVTGALAAVPAQDVTIILQVIK